MRDPIRDFGLAVHIERKRQKITQQELAEKLGMTIRTLSKIENGKDNPRFDTVAIIVNELRISFDSIILDRTYKDSTVPYCVRDYFAGMSETQAKKYIDLCQQVDLLASDNT